LSILRAISWPLLAASGLTAYIVSSWLLVLLRLVRATTFAPRVYWACGIFGSTHGAALFAGRVLRAIAFTLLIPLLYVIVFEIIGNAELAFGALLGSAHGVFVGITLPIIAARHGCAQAPSPGFFGWRLGGATPLLIIFVYALYGATLGYVYVIPAP
jgi:hypothetical protein